MRSSRLIAVLLGLNLGLAGLVIYLVHLVRQTPPPPPPIRVRTTAARPSPALVRTNVVTVVRTNEFRWAQLESEDYRTYIQRLRAVGCPEQTIRDIVIADIDKMLAPRRLAAAPGLRGREYWQPDEKELESYRDYREWQRQEREIDFEKRDVIRELMGVDLVAERMRVQGQVDYRGQRLGFLPEDKRSEVRKLLEVQAAEEVAIREKTWEEGEPLTDEDKAKLRQLAEGHEAAVKRLLSAEEFERYQLAMSPAAYAVRDSLFGMNPTEDEFKALYHLRRELDTAWPEVPPEGSPDRARWEKARSDLEARVRQELGETRYAEYARAQDPDYRQLRVAAARYQVSEQAATDVYGFKQILEQQRARLMADEALTPRQKNDALQAISAEAERSVRRVLGDKAYGYYRRLGQGDWIQGPRVSVPPPELTPAPASPVSTASP
jgi:hypothetical protein